MKNARLIGKKNSRNYTTHSGVLVLICVFLFSGGEYVNAEGANQSLGTEDTQSGYISSKDRKRQLNEMRDVLNLGTDERKKKLIEKSLYSGDDVIPKDKKGKLYRQAQLAVRTKDYDTAEKMYLRSLSLTKEEEDLRDEILLELGIMYEKMGAFPKVVAVYEKYIETNPGAPGLPDLYLSLGRLYRKMGAFNLAVAKFYNVLNVSLNISPEDLETYKQKSQVAQMEIAETYYLMGEYEDSVKFFSRLELLNLSHELRAEVRFKSAYSNYVLGKHKDVVIALKDFHEDYPGHRLTPESLFLLANAYKRLDRSQDAIEAVFKILSSNYVRNEGGRDVWLYWKKKTGNQLANEFFEQNDFMSALKIYQAMAALSKQPEWQWPVIYQIGLCFERLRMYPKAKEAYELLLSGEEWKDMEYTMTESLKAIQESAKWRLEHQQWSLETAEVLDSILMAPVENNP